METLPDELLLDILAHLTCDGDLEIDRCFAWNLTLLSRRFNILIKTELYKQYSFDLGNPTKFCRSMKESPRLGEYVKSVTWGWSSPIVRHHDAWSLQSQRMQRPWLTGGTIDPESVARPGSLGTASTCVNRLTHNDNTDLGNLLKFTPNLEFLSIQAGDWSDSGVWLKSIVTANTLRRLTHVEIGRSANIINIMALLTMPSLRKLRIEALDTIQQHFDEIPDPIIANHVIDVAQIRELLLHNDLGFLTQLQEKGCFVEELKVGMFDWKVCPDFVWLVQQMRGLKKLDFEQEEVQVINTEPLIASLLALRPSIETLRHIFEYNPHYIARTGYFRRAEHIRSLDLKFEKSDADRGLPDAHHLENLLRSLPEGLTYLALEHASFHEYERLCPSTFIDSFADNVTPIRAQLPSLKALVIAGWSALLGSFPCQRQLATLQTVYAARGIDFRSRPADVGFQDISSIEYIEPGWVWVQPVDLVSGHWTSADFPKMYWPDSETCVDDWTLIDANSVRAVQSDGAMDQFQAQQSAWYLQELRKKSGRAHQ